MAKFQIVIDNTAVFADVQKCAPDVVLPISFTIDGNTLEKVDEVEVRAAHKEGRSVRTQITPKDSTLALEKLLEEGKDVLLISVSSGLSESFAAAKYITQGLQIKYPNRKIVLVDSLSCGAGEGLLFALATKWQQEGLTIDEVADKLNLAKLNLHHLFTTDDAGILGNSGLIAPAAVVNITPIFDFGASGHVCVFQKTLGKKKSLSDIVKYVAKTLNGELCPTVVISYGAESDAQTIGKGILAQVPEANVVYAKENQFVTAYLGDNSIAVCFFGEARK